LIKAYFSRTPWQSTRRPFFDVSLFSDPLEFRSQTTQFSVLIIVLLPFFLRFGVALYPGIEATDALPTSNT
jgi:hypothetical protein